MNIIRRLDNFINADVHYTGEMNTFLRQYVSCFVSEEMN
jgi:hypothetical protein